MNTIFKSNLHFSLGPPTTGRGPRDRNRLCFQSVRNADWTTTRDGVDSGSQNTTVETAETAEGEVTLAVERTTHEGTVLVTSVSEKALNASEDLEVAVDGEAAVEAETHTQLKSAVGSDQSRYVVESAGSASADASADVLVAVNHFSERTVSMQSASDEQTTDESSDETTQAGMDDETMSDGDDGSSGSTPGFTATASVVALLAAALFARLR